MRLCTTWRTEDERHHAHETILEYVQKAPDDVKWEIDKREFDEMIATKKKNPLLDQMVFQMVSAGVRVGWGSTSCSMLINVCLSGAVPTHLLQAGPFSFPSPPMSTTMVFIVRPPDAFRPLTLCNCDCKIMTTAICFGLHWYSIRCIHPAQRCISSRQMTDNIFEVETTALAHVTCATRDSGILLTDFASAYGSFTSLTRRSCRGSFVDSRA